MKDQNIFHLQGPYDQHYVVVTKMRTSGKTRVSIDVHSHLCGQETNSGSITTLRERVTPMQHSNANFPPINLRHGQHEKIHVWICVAS